MAAYEVLLLNTAIPQIQAAQTGDTYVVPRDIAFSTVANLANGTNLLPSLTFSSDTNTGIYREGADALGFTAGGGTNQMVLTSTGLGIGTNNPAYKLDARSDTAGAQYRFGTSDNYAYLLFGQTSGVTQLTSAGYANAAFAISVGGSERTRILSTGQIQWSPDGSTQAMTLDASGKLGIAVTNPSAQVDVAYGDYQTAGALRIGADLGTTTRTNNTRKFGAITAPHYDNSEANLAVVCMDSQSNSASVLNIGGGSSSFNGPSTIAFYTSSAGLTDGTERAQITSGGDLYVGTQTALNGTARLDVSALTGNNVAITAKNDAGANQWLIQAWNAGTSGDNAFVQFATETAYTGRGSITYNRTAGLVAYNTTSDYRAKDILGPVANSGATIDALKVYEGKMKGATQSRPMLVAHEAQEHAPYAVTGEKDGVNEDGTPKYQQMDVSSLVPLLLAEIQSLRARVAQLEQGA